jgi:hypothetical protein
MFMPANALLIRFYFVIVRFFASLTLYQLITPSLCMDVDSPLQNVKFIISMFTFEPGVLRAFYTVSWWRLFLAGGCR